MLFHLLFARFYKINQISSIKTTFKFIEKLREKVNGLVNDKIKHVLDKAEHDDGNQCREFLETVIFIFKKIVSL